MESIIFPVDNIFDVYLDIKKIEVKKGFIQELTFKSWEEKVQEFKYIEGMTYFDILVPTIDSVKFTYIAK